MLYQINALVVLNFGLYLFVFNTCVFGSSNYLNS